MPVSSRSFGMSDVKSTKDLTRDEFVTCCLLGLDEWVDKSQSEDYELGSPEEQAWYEN